MDEREQRYQEEMNLGHSAAWDQKWNRAAEHYRNAVKLGPRQVQAINNLGLAYFQLHQYNEAEVCYKQAAKLTPDDPLAVERLAQIYERTGKIRMAADYSMMAADLYLKIKDATKAIENWTRITQLIPEHLKAHSRLAIVHERLGHIPQAVREYISVAALLQDVGQVNEAVLAVEKAVKIAPENMEARQALELVRSNKTLPKPVRQRGATGPLRMAAVREMEVQPNLENTSIARQGPDPITEARQKALTDLAGLLFDVSTDDLGEGDSKGLMGVFGHSKADDLVTISKLLGAAIDLQTRANHEEAARELKKAVDLGLDVPATYFNLGLLYSKQNRPDRAIRYLQMAINHPEFALASHLLIAQQYFINERVSDAASAYMNALREADTTVVPEDQRENLRTQYEALTETIIQKNDTKALTQLCSNIDDLLSRRNWRDHVVKARRQLPPGVGESGPAPLAEIITEAKDTQIVEAIAAINELARNGHLRSAMEEAFLLVSEAPTYLPLHIHMAELLLQMDNTKGAIDKMIVVSEAYAIRGEAKRSVNLLKRVVEIAPMDFNARSRLIRRLTAIGEVDSAIHEYIKLADVQYRLAQLDQARSTYEKALRLAQQNKADLSWSVRILKQMADIDIQRLDWRQALRVYEQLRTLSPDDELTRTRLIELNVRLGQRSQATVELDNFISYLSGNAKQETALAYLEKLVADNEEMSFARSKLAEYYQQIGRTQDAIDQWDKVAEIMVVEGNTERAKEVIRAILVLNPPNAEQYRAALQQLG
ncbi:tetratricopeptide repeat protein [bacterium]|nr:tetratricopeptide repeat protein [bacterium]MCB2179143.1 tetratricopeptide repeat protein [bacterium]